MFAHVKIKDAKHDNLDVSWKVICDKEKCWSFDRGTIMRLEFYVKLWFDGVARQNNQHDTILYVQMENFQGETVGPNFDMFYNPFWDIVLPQRIKDQIIKDVQEVHQETRKKYPYILDASTRDEKMIAENNRLIEENKRKQENMKQMQKEARKKQKK